VIFHLIKVAKHIWDPCCHLAAGTDSYFALTVEPEFLNMAKVILITFWMDN